LWHFTDFFSHIGIAQSSKNENLNHLTIQGTKNQLIDADFELLQT